ncbi:MAG: leucine-rich repeat domain-containing protein [Spirochaetes bacterium]|nr:leucine-rich repeat domain-containing protein [Spirochaetota bacterium]
MENFKRKLSCGCRLFFLLAVAAVFLSSCENYMMQQLLGDLPSPDLAGPPPAGPPPAGIFLLGEDGSAQQLSLTATITAFQLFDSFDGRLVIPATIGGRAITGINEAVFHTMGITSLVIPDTVITIGQSAFHNNNISSLTIGSRVQTIGAAAFRYNSLQSVVIPNSVNFIGDSAFADNPLTSISIGGLVNITNANAFPDGFVQFYMENFFGSLGRARFTRPNAASSVWSRVE